MNEENASVHSDAVVEKTVEELAIKTSLDTIVTKLSDGTKASVREDAPSAVTNVTLDASVTEKVPLTESVSSNNIKGSGGKGTAELQVQIATQPTEQENISEQKVDELETAGDKTKQSTEKHAKQRFVDNASMLEEEKAVYNLQVNVPQVVTSVPEGDTISCADSVLESEDSETYTVTHDTWIDDLRFPETEEEIERAKNLFSMVMDSERIKMMKFSSMLISGFGLRNYPSLCKALEYQYKLDQEYKQRKQKEDEEELEKLKRYREIEHQNRGEYRGESDMTYSNLGSQTDFSSITASTHQNTAAEQRRRIEYLIGLHASDGGWEEHAGMSSTASLISELKDDGSKSCGPEKEEPLTGSSDAMRQAQQYLRTHHIFEFFQFLIVHLLSIVPENPIEYLLLLLDKLLIYRSGLGEAPLHYKKRHLEQLFYLMDRMRTGFIDLQQYKTGMNTIGIKCFNSQPPLNADGQVSKEFFVDEALQCSCHVLNNIIRLRKTDRGLKQKYYPV